MVGFINAHRDAYGVARATPFELSNGISGSALLEGHILSPVLFLFPGTCDAPPLPTAVLIRSLLQ